MTRRYLLDSNILLRFLSGNPKEFAQAAMRLFKEAGEGKVQLDVTAIVVAETMDRLVFHYGVGRKEAVQKVSALLRGRGFKVRDGNLVFGALDRLLETNLGFADAFLEAGSIGENVPVASFDEEIGKQKDVKRVDPRGLFGTER